VNRDHRLVVRECGPRWAETCRHAIATAAHTLKKNIISRDPAAYGHAASEFPSVLPTGCPGAVHYPPPPPTTTRSERTHARRGYAVGAVASYGCLQRPADSIPLAARCVFRLSAVRAAAPSSPLELALVDVVLQRFCRVSCCATAAQSHTCRPVRGLLQRLPQILLREGGRQFPPYCSGSGPREVHTPQPDFGSPIDRAQRASGSSARITPCLAVR